METPSLFLGGFLLAAAAPWLSQLLGRTAGWVLASFPLAIIFSFAGHTESICAGLPVHTFLPWVPSLDISLSFSLDGLSALFVWLICAIGALILIYAGGYLAGHPQIGRFYAFLLLFMTSMLGLVLADNLINLFIFWELTSLSSYFLIGFENERPAARSAALQALLLTGAGGLALLAGLILLGQAGETFLLSEILSKGEQLRHHALYLPAFILILGGAVTKSAQFPFHFWLPAAMEAPTPVSAYLHSATMVKAGVYLLARLSPVMGGTEVWHYTVVAFGAITVLVGAYLALVQTDLKRLLACATVSTLGLMVMLVGVGTPAAIQAAVVLILAHALYKGALFLVAGAVDHETGTRDVDRLKGLARAMPITALAAGLAALSMAGLPPFLGFIAKETVMESLLHSEWAAWLVLVALLGSMSYVAVALLAGIKPFFGRQKPPVEKQAGPVPSEADGVQWVATSDMGVSALPEVGVTGHGGHEAPFSVWLGPVLLAGSGLVLGLFPVELAKTVLSPAVTAILGRAAAMELSPWHGFSLALALGILGLAGGAGLYAGQRIWRRFDWTQSGAASSWGPAGWYEAGQRGLTESATLLSKTLQSGYLRYYLLTILVTSAVLMAAVLFGGGIPDLIVNGDLFRLDQALDAAFYEAGLVILILIALAGTALLRSRLAAIAALGVVGYGVALVFILFSAPDLAMTQFLMETLTLILFVLVFYHVSDVPVRSNRLARGRDLLVALSLGALVTCLVLTANAIKVSEPISRYFVMQSLPEGHGRNIVNVILVDFRGLDTLGEITVLAVAGVGVFALLKARPFGKRKGRDAEGEKGEA